ncbi:MAG: hypothetical protein LM558_04350 [Thermosphaera sp.]|nr:hypothetical protein [Thermosphaera sp.]
MGEEGVSGRFGFLLLLISMCLLFYGAPSRSVWSDRIRDMLVKTTLYQFKLYPAGDLDRELTMFLKEAEEVLCRALRRNGATCYRDYAREGYSQEEIERLLDEEIRNWRMLGVGGMNIARLIRISKQFKDLEAKPLSDKILLFDELIHAEHYGGGLFNVDIPRIKRQADREVQRILRERGVKA